MTESLPKYTVLNKSIQKFLPNGNAAQLHGLLCGYLSATGNVDNNSWEELIPELKNNEKAKELLEDILEKSYLQLNEFSFEFKLILPDEKTNINMRAEGLGLWCQGFLTGLELNDVAIENREPDQVSEVIDDLIEISQISFGEIAENEEDESAYVELVEYVRLSVLMIFQELNSNDDASLIINEEDSRLLH